MFDLNIPVKADIYKVLELLALQLNLRFFIKNLMYYNFNIFLLKVLSLFMCVLEATPDSLALACELID